MENAYNEDEEENDSQHKSLEDEVYELKKQVNKINNCDNAKIASCKRGCCQKRQGHSRAKSCFTRNTSKRS